MADNPAFSVVLVDDEPLARARVRQLLQTDSRFVVVAEASDGQTAVTAIIAASPDVIILDIKMPDLDGFEVLDAIHASNPELATAVVFVTAYDRFAVRAFEANAADYLLKPIEEPRFRSTLDRVYARLLTRLHSALEPKNILALTSSLPDDRRYLSRIAIPERARVILLPVTEIESVTASDNYVEVWTNKRAFLLRARITDIAARLNPLHFSRIHRSHLVAHSHVRELVVRSHGEYDIQLASGRIVRSSRGYRETVRRLVVHSGARKKIEE